MAEKQNTTQFSIRAFKPGDEANLVDFLNLSYPGGWGSVEEWEYLCSRNPFFVSDNVFIIESNGQIVGYRSFELVDLIIRGKKVPIALLHDTAIHPDYRGFRLYSRLHEATLKAAKSKGACLADAGNSRGSITYKHNKKTGFVEIKRSWTYIKPINSEKVFREQVSDFIVRREELRALLRGLREDLRLCFGGVELSLKELLNENTSVLLTDNKKGRVRIILSQKSFPGLVEFASSGKLGKIKSFICLLLSRQMKIRFSSPLALGRVAWAGAKMVRYV